MSHNPQLSIDFEALARIADSPTSAAAAASVDGKRLADRVFNELLENGPGTTHELAERLQLSLVTVSPRMRPLCRAGRVRAKGVRDGRTEWEAVRSNG